MTTSSGLDWLFENAEGEPQPVAKSTTATQAWFTTLEGRSAFAKWYPAELRETWVRVETAVSGAGLHPAIVPLRRRVDGPDGTLLVYDRVAGVSLEPMETRARFAKLPLVSRTAAVLTVAEALAAIVASGIMVVDWYEGNMIYDFDADRLWLFDWELGREGGAFTLEMDANYGSSRLMAPEEFVRGSLLDEATLVFNVGRYALLTLPELAEPLAPVLARATYPARSGRTRTLRQFATEFRNALA